MNNNFKLTPKKVLHLTGLLFLTNAIHAAWKGQWIYSSAFIFLTLTTFILHSERSYDSPILYWLDQVAMYLVIGIGAIYFWSQHLFLQSLAGLCVIIIIVLYRFREDGAHALIHLFSSVGHHYLLL